MRTPSRRVIEQMKSRFEGFDFEQLSQSPNSLPFIASKGEEKYFIKIVDSRMAIQEGLDGVEESLISISSDHIVKLLESFDIDDNYKCLRFEYIEGVNLDSLEKPLADEEIRKIAIEMSEAINTLWSHGIVHRDIKPLNVMKDTARNRYVLVDLGIGYFSESPFRDNTRSTSNGSRFYSSPEQFASNSDDRTEITFSSDQFSLGLVLFELATGSHPYMNYDQQRYNNYGAAVSLMDSPKLSDYQHNCNDETIKVIDKMVSTAQADRFMTTESLLSAVKDEETTDPNRKLNIYIQDTDDGAGYSRLAHYMESSEDDLKPDGVMITMSNGSSARLTDITNMGLEVIVDPMTFRLPYRDAKTTNIKSKLKLDQRKVYTPSLLPSNINKIIENAIDWQSNATSIILPYFAVRDSVDDYLQFNKDIWREGRKALPEELSEKKVYGGIAIPTDILGSPKIRKALISHFLAKYDIDGIFVVFENDKQGIKSLDDDDILEGIKEILDALYIIGDVIVARSDMAILPLLRGGTFVTSFSDSRRRFSFADQMDSPSAGGGGAVDRKMKYYCDPLLTFLEEKTTLVALATISGLQCDCPHCESLQPFERGVPVNHQLTENHFYYHLARIRNDLNRLPNSTAKDEYLREKITQSIALCETVRRDSFLTSQAIPNHEGLLGLIDY